MVTEHGYKQTEIGLIPMDWDVVTINDLLDLLTDFEANGSFADVAGNVRVFDNENFAWYVRATDLENKTSLEMVKYVDEASYKFLKKTSLFGGEVLITKRGEIGKVYLFPKCSLPATLGPNLYLLKLNQKVIPTYIYLYFKYGFGKRLLKQNDASTTLGALYKNDVKAINIPLPPLHEQRLIAAALNDVDALLASLDALIAKKRLIQQGAMQELLTGKRRLPGFSGEWDTCTLADIGSFSKGRGIKKDDVVGDGIPCIRYGEIYTHYNNYIRRFISFIPSEIAKQSQRIMKGDLLFTGSGETAEGIGKCVAFLGEDEAYAGGDIVILTPKGHDSMFLGYLMNSPEINKQKARMGQGDAVVHISSQKLGQLRLSLPGLKEQQEIANVLSDMDSDILAFEQQRDKTRLLKQGMMQELLTGRTRLV